MSNSGAPRRDLSVWRDLLIAIVLAVASALVAARIDLHESLFAYTRRWESLQLDELPTAIFVFAVCLTLLYARRHAELRRALQENRALAQRTLGVQEAERKHLARELHDELGQYLNAIKLDAQSLQGAEPVACAAPVAARIATNADHVYAVVSGMIRRLRPAALDELGLMAALEACVDRWRDSHRSIVVHLQATGDLDALGEALNLTVYRIAQEALTNCVKHARATRIDIDLRRQADVRGRDSLQLSIRDDGAGVPEVAAAAGAGHGIAGMRERVHLHGGRFELLSAAGRGVTIRAVFPLQTAER